MTNWLKLDFKTLQFSGYVHCVLIERLDLSLGLHFPRKEMTLKLKVTIVFSSIMRRENEGYIFCVEKEVKKETY